MVCAGCNRHLPKLITQIPLIINQEAVTLKAKGINSIMIGVNVGDNTVAKNISVAISGGKTTNLRADNDGSGNGKTLIVKYRGQVGTAFRVIRVSPHGHLLLIIKTVTIRIRQDNTCAMLNFLDIG